MKCLGKWCPKEFEKINEPGFVIRGGVLPFYNGKILLAMKKNGKYSDFGGGCKIKKKEKPFDCCKREYLEESLGVLAVKPSNITHILITGTKKPHQIVLMIKMDNPVAFDEIESKFALKRIAVDEGIIGGDKEITRVEVFSLANFSMLQKHQISESLYSIQRDVIRILKLRF